VTSHWDKAGSHELKSGYEWFRSQRSGGGSQSPTSYVFDSDFAVDASGRPLLDATGHLIPTFVPGVSGVDFIPSSRGAVLNVDNNSFYVQDHWAINDRWSADLGARYEHVKAESTGGIIGVDNNRIVPRLAVAYDVEGNGHHVIHATYGMYSGRYNEAQIGGNSPVVHAPDLFMVYQGPAGQGRDFGPGFNIANYPVSPGNAFVAVPPPSNVSNAPNLKSPIVNEFTTSYGTNLGGASGYAEATYVFRRTTSMIEDFQTTANGFSDVVLQGIDAGLATNRVFTNSALDRRQYQGLVFQSRYRISNRWTVNGHYTVQLQNDGNYEGETSGVPGATSVLGNYPEAFNAARFYPDGRLQDFQRHRFRMWSTYDFALGQLGDLSVSGLWRLDSARVYSLTASNVSLTPTQAGILASAGYPDAPPPGMLFFGTRGSQEFKGYGLFDTSINYNVPLFRTLRPWVKLDVYNLFNNQKLISWNTTVRPDKNSPKDSLGLPTGYLPGALFGQATSTSNFPAPFNGLAGGRTFRAAVGFRF
jgi:outer membrane receptor protein involved in Fe transport